jgi:hypothetical protein
MLDLDEYTKIEGAGLRKLIDAVRDEFLAVTPTRKPAMDSAWRTAYG